MANNKFITPDFRLHHVRQFIESITEPANTIYYVFAGKPTEYITGDNNIDAPNTDIESLTTRAYDEMVFAKQITSNDVKPLIKRYNWTTGTPYAMYDSLDKNLEDKAFYVVSQEGSVYYVFKCLYNNRGANSTSQPLFSATSADDNYYETADGYIWKYMYKIDSTTFNKFSTNDYIPVIPDANVSSNAINGEIDVVDVTYGGRFYNNYLEGQFSSQDIRYEGNALRYRITSANAHLVNNFYNQCVLKITSEPGTGQYKTIQTSALENGEYILTLDSAFGTDPTGSNYEISPQAFIVGDGRQTINAEARALVNAAASNTVYKIELLNKGKDYFLSTANVYADSIVRSGNSAVNEAQLRVIYSPKGGHGHDAESELFATRLGISVKFSNNENEEISTDNDFRTIGILKDPRFKDVKLTYTSAVGNFSDTEELIQAKLNRISGTVGVKATSKNIFSIGTLTALSVSSAGNVLFTNTDVVTVANVVINAVANVVSNGTSYLTSLPLVSAGYGISDTASPVIFAANSTNGNVRHFNSRIIVGDAVTATANGRSYSNSDYIEISGTGVSVNAIVSITTNTIGGILTSTVTNSGKGFACNEIAYIQINNGGFGYSNGAAVSFSGGGATSTANAFTDALGNVTSIVFTSKGIGYTSPPSVTVSGSPSVTGSFTAILQANGITVKIANSSGGYSNGAKIISAATTANGDIGAYSNSDVITFVSPSSTHGNAVASIVTNGDGSLNYANVNAGNNFGFNLGNTNIDYFVANSTGGFKRRFDSKIVTVASITNNAPSYRLKSIVTGPPNFNTGTDYDNTRILRVDIVDGGIGYDSTANNIIVFNGSGSAANAYYTNDSVGKITSITMVANGTGYGNTVSFSGNTSGVSDADNFITVTHTLGNGQPVFYYSASSQPTLAGLTNNTIYYVKDANTIGIKLSLTPGGSVINIGNTTANTTQFLRSITTVSINAQANGIGANLIPVLANSVVITANGTGHGAVGFFINNSSGFITNVIVANGGFGYVNPPIITAPTTGTAATLTAYIEGVSTGFSNGDLITFYGGTANGTANIIANGYVSNINNLYNTNRSHFVGTRESICQGVWFKPDGTRFYIVGSATDTISQYDLSTAWDITTASLVGNSVSGVLRQTTPYDIFMTANGTSLYVSSGTTSPTNANGVLQFSLSQAWNVQTVSYVANVVTQAREPTPTGLHFKSDGSRMFVVGATADKIQQYDLSTPWDVTTATYVANVDPYVDANAGYGSGLRFTQAIRFNDDGTQVFVLDSTQSKLLSMPLTQAWNVQSMTTSSVANLSLDSIDPGPVGIYTNVSLGKFWILTTTNSDTLYEYQAQPVYTTTLTDSGGGFSASNLQIKVANSSGGNTRYLNANIIQDIVVSSGGFVNFGNNTDVVYVTNGNINAVGNAVTNATGGLTAVNLTVSGAGFVNASSLNMYTVNSTGGDFRYFNTNVVSSITISDGGTGYNNTDYIIISSPGGVAALANIETSTTGVIVSTRLSNRGKGIVPWYVSNVDIISGGSGYSNTDLIQFCGGGGTNANAVLLTNTTGGIVRAYLINGGENYDCAPTVEIANSSGGNSTGIGASLVAKVAKPTTLRVYNSNGNPSIGTFADLSLTVRPSPTLVANLVYAPTLGNTSAIVTLSAPATLNVQIADSANITFRSTQSANVSLILADNRTTFDSSISSGDKIYLQTTTQSQVLTVDEVANSTWLTVTQFPSFTNDAVAISVAKVNAKGTVKERGTGYVNVTNVYGFFVQSNDIIGVSSRAYASVIDVAYNNVSKTGTNVDQLFVYNISSGDPSGFEEDEIVHGGIDNQATAYFHSANSTAIRVVRPSGLFYSGNTVSGANASVVLDTGDVYKYEGDFVRGSGDIIYIENVEPISRSNTQSETIKLVLEF